MSHINQDNRIVIKIYYIKQLNYNADITHKGWHLYIYLTVSICGNASCKHAMLKIGSSVETSR